MGTNSILIVDDALESRLILRRMLGANGYDKIHEADGAAATFTFFGLDAEGVGVPRDNLDLDLILLDIVMPDIDGIELCRRLKSHEQLRDIPVIMVTADNTDDSLRTVFDLGVADYIQKPVKQVELCARVKAALRLKREMDRRRDLTNALEEANRRLQRMALVDGLTGIANRRNFDDFLDREWRRCQRDGQPIAICLFDIDYFKLYNDSFGHLQGDEVLKQVATALQQVASRPGDLVARFGGEEFVFVLSGSDQEGAQLVVQRAIEKIRELAVLHPQSPVNEHLTVSCGISAVRPHPGLYPNLLLDCADKALYEAKQIRNNQVVTLLPPGPEDQAPRK
ncbi:diguanylate cyclase domain-containing protein [Desulfurivibrio alkaliphilus]|uniref:diguanylate cyclase n=1 Tax=Desulfurivibrio alkaliphilus (strain DSM 19089 / UNIQEM U267 / AHT2) TaxID=589865 RepID=D6Z5S6_DESAT|nr:diguanylate cyclase [Desulfurivibrio alkaliphilus]ADH84808.1 response regulator receiver modulated diguanylate cyclase [Desulfurivibrio alkaliphilus AHT 2]